MRTFKRSSLRQPHLSDVILVASVGYAGVLAAVFAGTAATALAVGFGVTIAILGVVVAYTVAIQRQLDAPPRTFEILEGEDALMTRYEDLRSGDGLTKIQAVWSATYPATAEYFRAEARFLQANPSVRVERFINPKVLDPEATDALRELALSFPDRVSLFRTTLEAFECFVCHYQQRGGSRGTRVASILALNEVSGGRSRPILGVGFDSDRDLHLRGLSDTLDQWFSTFRKTPLFQDLADVRA